MRNATCSLVSTLNNNASYPTKYNNLRKVGHAIPAKIHAWLSQHVNNIILRKVVRDPAAKHVTTLHTVPQGALRALKIVFETLSTGTEVHGKGLEHCVYSCTRSQRVCVCCVLGPKWPRQTRGDLLGMPAVAAP